MSTIQVGELVQNNPVLDLRVLAGEAGLENEIQSVDINRPGLALAGYYKNFAKDRLQVFGKGEFAYLADCTLEQNNRILAEFFKYSCKALVFTHNNKPLKEFLTMAQKTATPVLTTSLSTHKFIVHYTHIIEELLAPQSTVHGELIDVFGVGVFLTGPSGIGKSETALELLERGHRLVADDMVQIRCVGESKLFGNAPQNIAHHMELRGIGIINVKDLFGVGAINSRIKLDLNISLQQWDEYDQNNYDRFNPESSCSILGIELPKIILPVRPGSNIPVLIETTAMNHRSKHMGFDAGRQLNKIIQKSIDSKQEKLNL